jgi:hypothetical protein
VIVHIINVVCAMVGEAESHAPVGSNGHRIKALQVAPERVKVVAGKFMCARVSAASSWARMSRRLCHMLGNHATRVVVFVKALKSLVAE